MFIKLLDKKKNKKTKQNIYMGVNIDYMNILKSYPLFSFFLDSTYF